MCHTKELWLKKYINSSLQVGLRYLTTAKTCSGYAYQKAYIFQAIKLVINGPQQPYQMAYFRIFSFEPKGKIIAIAMRHQTDGLPNARKRNNIFATAIFAC